MSTDSRETGQHSCSEQRQIFLGAEEQEFSSGFQTWTRGGSSSFTLVLARQEGEGK